MEFGELKIIKIYPPRNYAMVNKIVKVI